MAVYVIVQCNGGFLPETFLLLTQAPIVVWFDGTIIIIVYYCLLFCFAWWPCITINVSLQYNSGLLPDIILLNHGYYHRRGTRLNAMKRFCLCSL